MANMSNAQLFWDTQNPSNIGWWLRFWDETGTEQGTSISGTENATTEELAAAVEAESHWIGEGTIKVIRGEQPSGTITVRDGSVEWAVRS